MINVTPFKVSVPQSELDLLKQRLKTTRWADDFGNQDWTYGVERGWLQEMANYWCEQYDWRATEAEMNRYPHFKVEIDGIPIHFIHIRGKGSNPTPLILSHGWPWTFLDYKALLEPPTDPVALGGREEDAFDLVVPSLPGFGFSTPLRTVGVDIPRVAQLWDKLMTEVLGYKAYGAAGGDWGAGITSLLGNAYSEHLKGVYMTLTTVPGLDPLSVKPEDFSADETWMVERAAEAVPLSSSHIAVHSLDPQTLAYSLVDSPVGTAAWLWERRRTWSDCGGDLL